MDVVVLGTSNCIGSDSFIHKIRAKGGVALHNFSLGACTSSLGLCVSPMIPATSNGLAVMDFAQNDGWGFYVWGEEWRRRVEENFRTITSALRSLNYVPIAVLEPVDLDVKFDPIQEEIYAALCAQEMVSFINLRKVFLAAVGHGGHSSVLMRDRAHMSAAANSVVGTFFSSLVERMVSTKPSFARFVSDVVSSRFVPATELFTADRLVVRRSSLRIATCGRLEMGEVLQIPADENHRIAAVMVNTGAKGGIVSIRGADGEVVKSLTSYWSEAEPEIYSSLLVDILARVCGGPEGITIEIVEKDRVPSEATLMSRSLLPGRYGELEIEGVLLTRTSTVRQEAMAPVHDWLPLDLGALPETESMKSALAALRPSARTLLRSYRDGFVGKVRRLVGRIAPAGNRSN